MSTSSSAIHETTTRSWALHHKGVPMHLTILFEQQDLLSTSLYIKGRDAEAVELTVIHESVNGTTLYGMLGNESLYPILVQDKEAVIILARYHAAIVASAVLEVDIAAMTQGYVLHPRSLYNALLEQCEGRGVSDDAPNILVRRIDAEISAVLASMEVL